MVQRSDIDNLNHYLETVSESARNELGVWLKDLFGQGLERDVEREFILSKMVELNETYGSAAATAGSLWYSDIREKENVEGTYVPDALEVLDEQKIRKYSRRSLGHLYGKNRDENKTLEYLNSTLHRAVKDAGRGTVQKSALGDPNARGWARVPAGAETCAFCDMLASRGFVYSSAKSAGKGQKFHSHCDCQIVPSWRKNDHRIKGYDPELLYQRYLFGEKELRQRVPNTKNPTDEEIAAVARRLLPSIYEKGYRPSPGDIPFSDRTLAPIADKQINHILNGDLKGGGHLHTATKKGKTHFPSWWTEADVLQAIEYIQLFGKAYVENENSKIFEGFSKGILIRLRVRNGEVGSIFPLQGDGVERYFPTGNGSVPLLNFRSEDYPDIYGHRLS